MIRRPPRSTLDRSSAASDVYKRQVPKRGFVMPFNAWLRGPLRDVLEETLGDDCVRRRGLLEVKKVSEIRRRFTDQPTRGQLDWMRPWLLMMIELWCREVPVSYTH